MKKILRLTKEFFFALFSFSNPCAYYRERLRASRSPCVLFKMRNGARYTLHANTNEIRMVNEIWNLKVYDLLLKFVKNGATVIDIGANIGIFSVKAARAAKNVRVFSYEPFPQSFAALQENIRLNGLGGAVFPANKAVAGKRGELELFFRPEDPGGVSMRQYGEKSELSSFKVPAVTLADIFSENKIELCDYLKMDCEGAEEEILLNVPKELFSRIKSITLEWHYDLSKLSIGELREFLEGLGYETDYNPSTLTFYTWRN